MYEIGRFKLFSQKFFGARDHYVTADIHIRLMRSRWEVLL